jgi:hypothetical protein
MPNNLLYDLQLAFKKLKANVYYDKTQLVFRNKLVNYEGSYFSRLEERFSEIKNILETEDDEIWKNYTNKLLNNINVLTFPKKVKYSNTSVSNTDIDIIVNEECDDVNIITEPQYFIDMDIEVQLIGVLWILYFGKEIEEGFYDHSYGNRLDKKLFNKPFEKFSPYLFKPYYLQYESWRDIGLKKAEEYLDDQKNIMIITLDLKSFYYSVDFSKDVFDNFFSNHQDKSIYIKRINDFIFDVLKTYSNIFGDSYNRRVILPIGFLPSNILSNWYLKTFDDNICTILNPIYYGRYVDDIIIIEKIETNSFAFKILKDTNRKENIIEHLFCKCKGHNNYNGILVKSKVDDSTEYKINQDLLIGNSNIFIQHKKVKIFYFDHNHSRALLSCFRDTINKNKSEFRFLPEEENIEDNSYNDIYSLDNCDSINKLRSVNGIDINKYKLSKYLGKLLKIGNIVDDKNELKFVTDIKKIFNKCAIIDNYTTWEKVIEYLLLEKRYDSFIDFNNTIIKAIDQINIDQINFDPYPDNLKIVTIHNSLKLFLNSAIYRSMSHVWGKGVKTCIKKLYREYETVLQYRINYCKTRMCDKYILPTIIDALGGNKLSNLNDNRKRDLSNYIEFINYANNLDLKDCSYAYHPYMVNPDDISISITYSRIKKGDPLLPSNVFIRNVRNKYYKLNAIDKNIPKYHKLLSEIDGFKCSNTFKEYENKLNANMIKVNMKEQLTFNIAIANASLSETDFQKALIGNTNVTYERYNKLSMIVKEAIKNKVDMLILPEAYVPFSWIKTLSQVSKKNQIAIITGVEHIKIKNKIYNLVATILPYVNDSKEYEFSLIVFHTKVHYSPFEKDTINGYRLEEVKGNNYDLFVWKGMWFATYCCYELASITDRSLFMGYADMLAIVEWNRDTNYYSNIIESLSRDIHCYCVQANSSNYGDSRITQPSTTDTKDIIRTKGGINDTILVGTIDIDKLRQYQYGEYSLQNKDSSYKPTPPNFNNYVKEKIVKGKIENKLWTYLKKRNK